MQLGDYIALGIGFIIGLMVIIYLMINQKSKVIEWLKYAVPRLKNSSAAGRGS